MGRTGDDEMAQVRLVQLCDERRTRAPGYSCSLRRSVSLEPTVTSGVGRREGLKGSHVGSSTARTRQYDA